MLVLVANLGSTSFKFRLFDVDTETQLAQGGVERIGAPESACESKTGNGESRSNLPMPNHAVAVQWCLDQLTHPETGCVKSVAEISAIGFKAVHGGLRSGVFLIDEPLLQEMQRVAVVAPAHNPPYIRAMRQLAESCGPIPLVAAFETDFHSTIPQSRRIYGIPKEWTETLGVQRWGFHGASHRYIAGRMVQLMGRSSLKMVSCHLGGSSSLCAIDDGRSVGTTMGMSPQSGLPQNNRVGDFDPFALPLLIEQTGQSLTEVLDTLSSKGGLLGISGVSGDMRDLRQAAATGHADAQLALDFFAAEVRRLLGGLLIELGPPDALVFTGGIGQNDWQLREEITRGLEWLGIEVDSTLNPQVKVEGRIDRGGGCQVWVVPTNEELVVARQVKSLLESR